MCDEDDVLNFLDRYKDRIPKIYLNEALVSVFFRLKYRNVRDKLVQCGASENKEWLSSFALNQYYKGYVSQYRYTVMRYNKAIAEFFLNKMGNPHKTMCNVIQVTGTNGKGSVSTIVASILRSLGYSVNLAISPAIINLKEECVLDGKMVDHRYYAELRKQIIDMFIEVRDTPEYITMIQNSTSQRFYEHNNYEAVRMLSYTHVRAIAALVALAENPADFHVIEVRCGGLYDETNVFESHQVLATIINYIQANIGSNDNSMYFRNEKGEVECSNRSMAYHKTHLGKPGVPLIVANQTPDTLEEIRLVAKDIKAPTFEYLTDWKICDETNSDFFLTLKGKDTKYHIKKSRALFEKFQTINTATAVATVLKIHENHRNGLKPVELSGGREFKIDMDKINAGISAAQIVARPQRILDGEFIDFFTQKTRDGQILRDEIDVITGVIKLNKNGVESIKNIINDDNIFSRETCSRDESATKLVNNDYFNFFIYTSGNNHAEDTHTMYFFDFIKNRTDMELVIYKKRKKIYDLIKTKLNHLNISYVERDTLSSSIMYVRSEMLKKKQKAPHSKYRVFILCDSMVGFDANIILLNHRE